MTSPTTQAFIDLASAAEQPVDKVGRKAQTLGRLTRAGIRVPAGVVLPAGWWKAVADDELRSELAEVYRRLDGPVAVRSSAVSEDGEERSFAGQYETVLSVDDIQELVAAVRKVGASGESERLRSYGHAGSDMAVLIQRMVPARAAGVAFTADPVTSEREVTIVSAVSGLGDRLVSGEADPDEWEVRADRVSARRTPESSLSEDQVLRVASVARKAQELLGAPQDIEWAFDGETVHVLQSRPITGLSEVEPIEPDIEVPEGSWMIDRGHYPSPISPMAASFYLPALEKGASRAFTDWGLIVEGFENRAIGWMVYGRMIPLGGKHRPAPPWWLLGIISRIHPDMRRQARRAEEALEGGRMDDVVERWWTEWRPSFKRKIAKFNSVPLGDLSDSELTDHLDELLDFTQRGQDVHFELFPPYMLAVAEMLRFCQDQLGWSKAKATSIMSGLSDMTTEPSRRLHELGRLARSREATADLLESDSVSFEDLRTADDGFAEALDAYLEEFGMRASGYDVLAPTLGEQEEVLLSMLRTEAEYDPESVERRQAEERVAAIEEARSHLSADSRALAEFEETYSRLEKLYPVREDNIFFTDNAQLGLVRLAGLELGRRLTERNLLESPEHIFFLAIEEARESLNERVDHSGIVRRRRGEREWALRHTPEPVIGDEPTPLPDIRALPRSLKRLMTSIVVFMENDLVPEVGDGVSGVAASPGRYTGTARVITSENDFKQVQQGDVLVCRITTPAWSMLFGRIGALITDAGGILSHSAIVAREHGIPAVVATGTATSEVVNGSTVTVDGNTGQIEIED